MSYWWDMCGGAPIGAGFAGIPGGAESTPATIFGSDLILWYDAVQQGLGVGDGNPIGALVDQSVTGNDASIVTGTGATLIADDGDGIPAWNFDGTTDYLTDANVVLPAQPWSYFILLDRNEDATNGREIWHRRTGGTGLCELRLGDQCRTYVTGYILNNTVDILGWHRITGHVEGASSSLTVNGSSAAGTHGADTYDTALGIMGTGVGANRTDAKMRTIGFIKGAISAEQEVLLDTYMTEVLGGP